MKFRILLLSLLPSLIFAKELPAMTDYQIIPQPQSIAYTSGVVTMNQKVKVFFSEQLTNEMGLLKQYLADGFGMQVEITANNKIAEIQIQLNNYVIPTKQDGYIFEVANGKIVITSNSKAGVLNGIQSLRQIIKKKENNFIVQNGIIVDYPAFSWRAFMLDEARHFKGKEVVKSLLNEMALLKMNVFHWHLTEDQGWRIEIKKYPKLTEIGAYRDSTEMNHFHSEKYDGKPHGGFYTQEEIKELVAYAAERHITVVPEIEMPGHASAAIAAYPWLGVAGKQINVSPKFGVHYDIFNVTDPKVIDFFSDVVDEIISLFPSPVIHIGGDEVRYDQWNESQQVKDYMAQNKLKTPAELQVFFTNNISNMLKSKGKMMMGWNDITGAKLHEYQSDRDTKDVSQKLAEGTIVQFWKGDPKLIISTLNNGYEIVNSYHVYTYLAYNYNSIPLAKAYSFNPVPEGVSADLEDKIFGLGCQMWGEFIPTINSMNAKIYPRIAAYAECGWTLNENKDYERFKQSLSWFLNKWEKQGVNYGPID